ncbi:MAG: hypothetical protein RL588_1103 [Pseudomonadota bacterium]
MKANLVSFKDLQVGITLQIHQSSKRGRIGYVQIVAGDKPKPTRPIEHVLKMRLQQSCPALHDEGDGEIHGDRPVDMGEKMADQCVFAA